MDLVYMEQDAPLTFKILQKNAAQDGRRLEKI